MEYRNRRNDAEIEFEKKSGNGKKQRGDKKYLRFKGWKIIRLCLFPDFVIKKTQKIFVCDTAAPKNYLSFIKRLITEERTDNNIPKIKAQKKPSI